MKSPFQNQMELYQAAGRTLADTAAGIGLPVDERDREQWGDILSRLSVADEIAEQDTTLYTARPVLLLEHLGLDMHNERLLAAAGNLAIASSDALGAETIVSHFDARKREAINCLGLLRYARPRIENNEPAWRQIGHMSIAGNYLDSVVDAFEDADTLPQFTAATLILYGTRKFIQETARIKPFPMKVLLQASNRYGLDRNIITKPGRVVAALRSRNRTQPPVAA